MSRRSQDSVIEQIRAVISERSVELGPAARPSDVEVELAQDEIVPGCRLFRATWGGARDARSLAGVVRADDQPNAYPGQSFAIILRRWQHAGSLPDALQVATAAAFLFDSDQRHTVIAEPGGLQAPTLIETADAVGVSFSWTDGDEDSRVTVTVDDTDRVTVDETTRLEGTA